MTKTIDNINLYTWFTDREMTFTPDHFVRTTTPVTTESKEWILEKLIGRFSLEGSSIGFLSPGLMPAFEDPKEAVFYELTWG